MLDKNDISNWNHFHFECDCPVHVVTYNSLPKTYNRFFWPICVLEMGTLKHQQEIKLWYDIKAGRTYNGARR